MKTNDFNRVITHGDYKNPEKLKKYYHRVEKILYADYDVYKQTKRNKNVNGTIILNNTQKINRYRYE